MELTVNISKMHSDCSDAFAQQVSAFLNAHAAKITEIARQACGSDASVAIGLTVSSPESVGLFALVQDTTSHICPATTWTIHSLIRETNQPWRATYYDGDKSSPWHWLTVTANSQKSK